MECPHCHIANPESAKFCINCGQSFSRVCPNCQTALPPQSKFCFNCGFQLQNEQPAKPKQSELQGDRRIVTILFCDVKGSTAMAEQLDPEEWAGIMNEVFSYLIGAVRQYDGTVARLMGDAILALFGAPTAHEDDPQRAVMAALDMVSAIQHYRQQVSQRYGLDFNIRVGINTGLVFAGAIGSEIQTEYTAMGDAMNLAARMEQTAQVGTIQITEETYKLVSPLFETEFLGEIEVKGKRNPIPTYRVLGRKNEPERLRGIKGLETAFVGRDTEYQRLSDAFRIVQQGRGQVAFVIGEAGLGKSHLIAKLRELCGTLYPEPLPWLEARGIPYETSRPYGLIEQLLSQYVRTVRGDIRESVGAIMTSLQETFIGIGGNDDQTDGQALKQLIFGNASQLFKVLSTQAPLVLVFDDMHWADPASVELLEYLFQLVEDAPILFLCASRPDPDTAGWHAKLTAESSYSAAYLEIALVPLTTEQSSTLVDKLVPIRDMPQRYRDAILQKAEGNPFYVEEVLRTLIDQGAIVRDTDGQYRIAANAAKDITIPNTLQSLLLARIDKLDQPVRYTLQRASVIGRSFYMRVLKYMAELAEPIEEQLSALQFADLIHEARQLPELEYMFRHELTREAAYQSILHRQRIKFHRQVAEAIETLFKDQLEEVNILAFHYFHAEEYERALSYYLTAGERALRLYANAEAADHYELALRCAERAHIDNQQWLAIYTQCGLAFERVGQYEAAIANYEQMEEKSRQLDFPAMHLAALMGRAIIRATANRAFDAVEGQRLLDEARNVANSLNDRAAEARILWNRMLLNSLSGGDVHERIRDGEQALVLARELQLHELVGFILTDIWYGYATVSDWDAGDRALAEAARIWNSLGNLPMASQSLTRLAVGQIGQGKFEEGIANAEQAFHLGQTSNNAEAQANSRFMSGLAHWERGEPDLAIQTLEDTLAIGEAINVLTTEAFARADLGWVYAELGDLEHGLPLIEAAVAAAEAKNLGMSAWGQALLVWEYLRLDRLSEAEIAAQKLPDFHTLRRQFGYVPSIWPRVAIVNAEIALKENRPGAALEILDDLYRTLQNSGVRLFQPYTLYLKAIALHDQQNVEQAASVLQDAKREAEATGSKAALWRILFELSGIERECGRLDQAQSALKQAQGIVREIASRVPSDALRNKFLSLPEIRRVLEQ